MIKPGEIAAKNFFVFDSQNLEDVVTRFYGYSIDEEMILNSNEETIVCDFVPNQQCGAWLYVDRNEKEIVIHQDSQGSFGLYLFQNGNYFALSNSFIMLVDFIKTKYSISLNREYANAMLSSTYCSHFLQETLIHEIKLLSRHDKIYIDLRTKTIAIERVDNRDFSIPVDSVEGLNVLDLWVEKWVGIIRKLKSITNNITVDLSGGMDSRITFILFLLARVDFSEIRVNSMQSQIHTFGEDFEIASRIASNYNILLNQDVIGVKQIPLQLSDIIEHSFYAKLGFHKQMYFHNVYNINPIYSFSGMGGESLKNYWKTIPMELQTFYSDIDILRNVYSDDVLEQAFLACLYRETEDRSHYGKACVEHFLANSISAAPLMDEILRMLSVNSKSCLDPDLLYAIIYTRYCPELLDIPFDSGHMLNETTVAYAKKINKLKPFFNKYKDLPIQLNMTDSVLTVVPITNPYGTSIRHVLAYLRKVYDSDVCKETFVSEFPLQIYNEAGRFADESRYYPLQQVYMVLAVTKILQDVRLSQKNTLTTPFSYFSAMLNV